MKNYIHKPNPTEVLYDDFPFQLPSGTEIYVSADLEGENVKLIAVVEDGRFVLGQKSFDTLNELFAAHNIHPSHVYGGPIPRVKLPDARGKQILGHEVNRQKILVEKRLFSEDGALCLTQKNISLLAAIACCNRGEKILESDGVSFRMASHGALSNKAPEIIFTGAGPDRKVCVVGKAANKDAALQQIGAFLAGPR